MKNTAYGDFSIILFLIAMVTIVGMVLAENLTAYVEITQSSRFEGLFVQGKIIGRHNIVQHDVVPYTVSVENSKPEGVEMKITPVVNVRNQQISNETTEIFDIPSGENKNMTFKITLDTVGPNSLGIIMESNSTTKNFQLSPFSLDVVTQERYYQIQDQKWIYYIGGILAIPAIVSVVKNLRDIFSDKQNTRTNYLFTKQKSKTNQKSTGVILFDEMYDGKEIELEKLGYNASSVRKLRLTGEPLQYDYSILKFVEENKMTLITEDSENYGGCIENGLSCIKLGQNPSIEEIVKELESLKNNDFKRS